MPNGWHRKTPNTQAEQARRRSYNTPEYREAKTAGQHAVDAGRAWCWRCGRWLPPGKPWHLGHDDHNRAIIRGPECVGCNLHAAAQAGARTRNGTPRFGTRHSRRW